jgi:ribosomal protein S18 acetylase RimI-like enzyme
MAHILDNPGWTALTTGSRHLGEGNDEAKYFLKDVAAFVGLKDNSAAGAVQGLKALYDVSPHDGPFIFISPDKIAIPEQFKLLRELACYQMVFDTNLVLPELTITPIELNVKDVPQMMELTSLTNPGPFIERTIEFGHYYGIFDGEKLVAMAGQRMHSVPYAEISAVCTHPDYLGRGYARQLLLHQVRRIMAVGGLPYLHVRDDNERPYKIYESMGFVTRASLNFYVLMKDQSVLA